ncbi:hypothetical protein THTE_0581 [Thermogutta terrifontis]|uniref:Uncharacterized protein n=1 Tax=Thermogutta terrifontis TaxID=1331910 RepID=A0A286RB52_9BACT|nr:hypothetical protein THTE_0581 [Thermogutta terrifontis]
MLAQDPLDGVNNIRLSGAIWPDNGGDPRTELKPGPVGEALKAHYFQRFEHISQILTPVRICGGAYDVWVTCRLRRAPVRVIFPRIPDSTNQDEVVFETGSQGA